MSDRWVVKRIEGVGAIEIGGQPRWHPIRTELGITAFGINAWRAAEAGAEIIGEHDELGADSSGHEELYLVLAGRARFTVGGETFDAPAGQLVFVCPEVKRTATAEEAGTVVLVVGGKRGEAFSITPWEGFAEGLQFFAAKEYDRAVEFFEQAHRDAPERANVLYNLACAESLVGRHEDALGHLERAIELDPPLRAAAQADADFDPIRADPRFPQPE
jgi:tetratricopeptide (TPR) repeat protein